MTLPAGLIKAEARPYAIKVLLLAHKDAEANNKQKLTLVNLNRSVLGKRFIFFKEGI